MNRKILGLIIFFNFLCVFNSCVKCPAERYFDYKRLEVRAEKKTISPNDKLQLDISFVEIEFLTITTPSISFGGHAYATMDCPKGYDGEKYPVVNIRVYSNSDFSENYLAGTDLIDLIKIRVVVDGKVGWDWVPLKDLSLYEYFDTRFLLIEERPIINKTHKFTVEFEKSNGEVVSGISPEIIWE